MWKSSLVFLSAATAAFAARLQGGVKVRPHRMNSFHLPADTVVATPTIQNSTFIQELDHKNPGAGNFSQWYMYSTEFWKGPGSPVILFTPGEADAAPYTSYLSKNRTTGVLAEKIGAAIICLEHRYWGFSSPFPELTSENLQYHTLDNAIQDLVNFASNAKLPFDEHNASNAQDVPWVLLGGSYSGALTAWTESVAPGTFWAYHASSAVVEAVSDFWRYFVPVQQGMPANCSKDLSLAIDYMDNILLNGSDDEVLELKTQFGLQNVTHNDDFMAALENGPWLWQSNQLYTGYSGFYQFCDHIEGVFNVSNSTNSAIPGPEGVGAEKAVAGYAKWMNETYLPGTCEDYGYDEFKGTYNTYCFNNHDFNSPLFRDDSLQNKIDRAWVWMTCNEPFGYWQDGAPTNRPSIVSRLVDSKYWIDQCALFFPDGPNGETYGIKKGKTEEDVNKWTGGWDNRNTSRLLYVNGEVDPWREATVSAESRPGGPLKSTEQQPVLMVPGGFHVSDLVTRNADASPGAKAVMDEAVAILAGWVDEWPKSNKTVKYFRG
ncbi:serine carboxypeptidase [Periconia macrospinosa]|uniref:Serine carboxypeptidase n=1 Tax=Periconia macrospinosa TaxID=97972 RepID=A0A2V1DH61_9PLEO|nr:serine carboxypeptidase [Periconia macrospinosa]